MKPHGATDLLDDPGYNPGRLIDHLLKINGSKTDRSVAHLLDIDSTGISRVRSKTRPLTASMVLSVHETTGIPFSEIRDLIGVPDAVF